MTALEYLSAIRFIGDDAGDFLHGQLSADILGLSYGESAFACYCEPKGRVLALMLVYRSENAYYVVMSSALAPGVINRLRIYVMRSRVTIEALNELSVLGQHKAVSPDPADLLIPLPDNDERCLILTSRLSDGLNSKPKNDWRVSELESGICWLCPETSGQFLPQMLGFDQLGAVNFRKGCYPGQEIVARTHYLGKVKRYPRVLHTDKEISPNPMDKIKILGNDQAYEAVVVDRGHQPEIGSSLLVVTRMDPDVVADEIEFKDQNALLLD